MKASMRSILAAVAGCLVLAVVGLAADPALAGGCNCTPPPVCCTPPSPPSPPSVVCCSPPGHNINIPGVNVYVAPTLIVNTNLQASVNASASGAANASGSGSAFGTGGGVVVIGGGGGGGGFVSAPSASLIQGLNVESGGGMARASYEATRTRIKKVVIEAVCLDDKAIPHPASQVMPDREIEESYEGELYRCIAGTHMQVTIADYSGQIDFSRGQTLVCDKNQALYHDHEGHVECRVQRPARDCNERSLLRRFGAGIKILTMVTIEKYTAYREERTESSSTSAAGGAMTLDGGVGGVMY